MPFFTDENSMRSQIENLAEGESFARCRRLDGDLATKKLMRKIELGLRGSVMATVVRIKQATGLEFAVETGNFRTRSQDIMMVISVTRMP